MSPLTLVFYQSFCLRARNAFVEINTSTNILSDVCVDAGLRRPTRWLSEPQQPHGSSATRIRQSQQSGAPQQFQQEQVWSARNGLFVELIHPLLRSQSVGDRWGREDRGGFKANNFRKDARWDKRWSKCWFFNAKQNIVEQFTCTVYLQQTNRVF